ncbi:carbohydrate ABC transporter permease [Phytoactinopolyspora limicola]|uniref:carbohydrate ABC transporter permease n=1 Tax=Phytoactinopolyspora limicola TaxID=2715536 RepID=UPI001A9C7E72|nr:carbohydrate ABC transporter permease [Phytoactinopolyspora limicola]
MIRTSRLPRISDKIEVGMAWLLGFLWIAPLVYVFWAAFREPAVALTLNPFQGWTLDNIESVWNSAPFDRYFQNTVLLVTGLATTQLVLGILAAYALARYNFPGRDILFAFVLLQLMIFPEILLTENFRLVSNLGLQDTIPGIAIPYAASAFCIFLMRQQFKAVPKELVEAAEIEGASRLETLWKVYLPLARPTIVAFGLVSVSFHWNNFLWPLVITRSPESRPVTVGIVRFLSPETGIDFTSLTAGTVIVVTPLLALFLLTQRQFIQSFMRSGIK